MEEKVSEFKGEKMYPKTLLRSSTLGDLRTLQHVVLLKDTATIQQVLKTLASHKVVSAPVVVTDKDEDHLAPTWPMNKVPPDVAGFVDVRDVITKFLKEIDGLGILEMQSMLKKMRALEEHGVTFSKHTIHDLNLTGGDGCFLHTGQQRVTLLELVGDALLNPKKRGMKGGLGEPSVVHRIAIFDSTRKIINIISQSDIIRHLLVYIDKLGDTRNKTLVELDMASKAVISVPPEKSAVEALKVMDDNKIGALAVVNACGEIIGTFSATDMRTITPEHFGSLALPVGEFLALEHGTEYSGYCHAGDGNSPIEGTPGHQFARDRAGRIRPRTPGNEVGQNLVVCGVDSTIEQVMDCLIQNRVHRVFVVDDDLKPVSVVTCTDLLRKLCELEY